ncbi:hypothetical protein DEU56DRAFT_762241 [Suillus clintonianus]|uniref:uncharacterized protein n=1 Tax=Suillus clintonianus TaxID=1904413 RepID=UPI001B87F1E6|nr:uncharacterized protein DEU56DRAFT_762241 [Suillus clintonianus]KAG2111108.1 hypothetical protein DEU56DRAFT_762241 [Suillus clintonianus]
MDSLGPESRNLHALLSSEIKQIMKEASAVPVFKGGVLQYHLLQKARQPSGVPSTQKEKLRKYFPMTVLGRISEPAMIVDNHGKILVWYLPNILSGSRVDLMNTATMDLRGYLLKSIPVGKSDKKPSWRSEGFRVPEGGGTFGAGRLTVSPAYFMQRRERLQDPLVTSASYSSNSVQQWLKVISGTELFFNAITAFIAPELFEAGLAAASKVSSATLQSKKTAPTSQWPSVFSGLELIVNRVTLGHRDAGGASSHYDLLASFGIGHNTTFRIEDLEAELDYFPGTLVLEHSVGPWQIGERFVLAHFMKDKVHDRVGVSKPAFPVQMDFLQLLGSHDTDHRPRKRVRREI